MSGGNELRESVIDLELVAQRILKLAEISMLEHLGSVERSQAGGLLAFDFSSSGFSSERSFSEQCVALQRR